MVIFIKAVIYFLAAFLAIAGYMKLKRNKKKPARQIAWVKDFKPATITFIAFLEISSAIGLVGPGIIRTSYFIIYYAAIGICILMALAGIYHSRKREYKSFALNIVIFIFALIVALNWTVV
jgi:hypothetical protein